jgi:hypothetical protein
VTTLAEKWDIHPEHFWLRGRRADRPVRFDETLGMWNVYGYPEALEVLNDHGTFSSDTARLFPVPVDGPLVEGDMGQLDPPEHRKLRTLVSHAFTPKIVADLEPRITRLTHELLDAVGDPGEVELMTELAYPLPVIVIAELLGVPTSDRPLFQRWMDTMSESMTDAQPSLAEDDVAQVRAFQVTMEQMRQLLDYLREHAAERRRRPRQDLLSQLVQAQADGARLTDDQVVNFAKMLLIAGYLTTTMLLGNTVLCLDAHPDQAALVRGDRSLVPTLIEESLRFLSPIAATYRVTTADVEIGGRRVPRDQMLMVWLAAANRDERQFADPDVFVAARDPNPHLGFARGVHFCLGAPLARLEVRIALNILLDRYPRLRTDPDHPPTFMPAADTTGVSSLRLRTR